mmetsp:Transcript_8236/g.24863  ORF Transcript_8236/g.24863 Transcript_8236/m.24863 type:complete len:267 (+) Transcript_8236:64-864(+)
MSLHSIDPSNLDWTTLLVTLGAGLAAATYFHRCVYRGVPPALPPPGGLQTKGTVQLERGDVGGEEEVKRDYGRALAAGGIHLLVPPAPPAALPPPADGGDREAAFEAALAKACGGEALSEATMVRLRAMLSVSPAVSLLLKLQCAPALQSHRFVVVCSGGGDGGGARVRVLTVGLLPSPATGKPRHFLTITSPDLTESGVERASGRSSSGRGGGGRGGEEWFPLLRYEVRAVGPGADVEKEIALEVPRWCADETTSSDAMGRQAAA